MSNSKYTREFKDSTVQLVLNSEDSALKIAKDLGLNDKTLYNWIKEYKKAHNIQTDYRRSPQKATPKETSDEELKRLRAENKLLKQERDILKKGNRVFRQRNSVKYAWIKEHKESFNINLMCKVLKVNRSSYYHWIKMGCVITKVDEKLNQLIKNIFEQSRQTYGARRIKEALVKRYGAVVSKRKIGNIMKSLKLVVKMKRRFKVLTTDSRHNYPVAPNRLNRDFYSSSVNNVYVGDITYIPTAQGWLYLATVIDIFSRKVVGWSMDDNMKVALVNDALKMAIKRRSPERGLIWHTDRGSQYASYEHKDLLLEHGIIQSMSKKGDCWDNAVAESFFHSLKTELTHHVKFQTKAEANEAIFEYIEIFYNRQRLHSSNNYMSPVEYEETMLQKEMVG